MKTFILSSILIATVEYVEGDDEYYLLGASFAKGEAAAKVKRVDYFAPPSGQGAEMLNGNREENADKVLELVAAKGGLK